MYGFFFIKKGKYGFVFVIFFKNFIEKWFFLSVFKKYIYVVWYIIGFYEDVCFYCIYVIIVLGFFISNLFYFV